MALRNHKILFSLECVDVNDDAALEEFARQVWERAAGAVRTTGPDVEGPPAIDRSEAHSTEESGE